MRAAKFVGAAVLGTLLALVLLYAYLLMNEATEPVPEETTVEETTVKEPVPPPAPAPAPVPEPEPPLEPTEPEPEEFTNQYCEEQLPATGGPQRFL